jgi:hypothetical protein
MDVTGIKKQYQFSWNYLDQAEYEWLRALHTRLIVGPHRMIDPLMKNRLSLGTSDGNLAPHKYSFYTASAGLLSNQLDYPAGLIGRRSVRWSDRTASSVLRLDLDKGTDVLPLETITHSIYLKGASAVSVDVLVAWYDRDFVFIGDSGVSTHSVTTTWARYSGTKTAPTNAVMGILTLHATATTTIDMAAPQLEAGSSATAWEQGGANPLVLIDQLATVSPRYPVSNVTMTLLEA